ncbi:hypothetical protein ACIQW9_12260 [Herminiimonas sp. NPDC097707]|uniref:Uncharacterized protein n=1 Tax=Herminiimonas arsenicoxydans TaxID=204773 RepID=A4GAK8_HERAR|nr:hypothetical protein HEAR3444 [Herminiimonas arsenicoxydans]
MKLEYKGYLISITAIEQAWGFSFGEWGGSYCVWQKGNPTPIKGFIEGTATSAYEAEKKALRIVKVAIDEALAKSSEQLLLSLAKLGDRFSL